MRAIGFFQVLCAEYCNEKPLLAFTVLPKHAQMPQLLFVTYGSSASAVFPMVCPPAGWYSFCASELAALHEKVMVAAEVVVKAYMH